jgi:hypothetical protein
MYDKTTYSNIFPLKTYTVYEDTNKGRVETIFNREGGNLSIGHALRDNHDANGQASDEVTSEPAKVCVDRYEIIPVKSGAKITYCTE